MTGFSRTYQRSDTAICDYEEYRLALSPLLFRGPAPSPRNPRKIAIFGATQSFGRYVTRPFSHLLSDYFGVDTANMSYSGAGPEFYTRRPELVDHANRTELLVLQVMSARSGDTFLYRIVREANVRRRGFFEATPARNPQHLIDEFIQQCGADAARSLLNDMRQRYMEATNDLLDMIKVPVVLLWFSRRTPAYQPSYGSQYGLLSSFPHAVDEEMVMAISKRTTAYCECVSKSGDPHQLVNRFTGELEYQGQGAARTCINGYYPTPAMHQDAFDALSSTIKKMKLLA